MRGKEGKLPGVNLGGVHIFPPISLAPMVGLSHSALRSVVRELGGCGLFFTEMLSTRRLPSDNPRCSPLLIRHPAESPLFYQIVTADLVSIKPAVDKLHALGADGIDLNLGCPAPAIQRQGAGSNLAKSPALLEKILRELRSATHLPISVKLRLGTENNPSELIDLCTLVENEGGNLLTIHARYDREKFCRKAKWAKVRPVVESVDIPVFVNGGVFTVEDARACLEQSGAAGLMLGRGCVQRPWLARKIARELFGQQESSGRQFGADAPGQWRISDIFFRLTELLEERFPPERRLGRLKQFVDYYGDNFVFGHHLRSGIQNAKDFRDAVEIGAAFLEKSAESKQLLD